MAGQFIQAAMMKYPGNTNSQLEDFQNRETDSIRRHTCAFHTFGCKVNQYETQLIREKLKRCGFKETRNPEFYIINGCTVTSHADKKCRNLIRSLYKKNPQAKIIVTGCYAQNYSKTDMPLKEISFFIPQDKKEHIVECLNDEFCLELNQKNKLSSEKAANVKDIDVITDFDDHSRAFVKVQDGCNNLCSYCIVPLMRVGVKSRMEEEIVKEVTLLAERGFKEIVLCGINLGAWGADFSSKQGLPQLIKKIESISGVERLRLSSIEFEHVTPALLDWFSRSKKLCLHLHIPLQSGDDSILEKMNRRYRAKKYLEKLKGIRRQFKYMSFTTDIMVGFPGESQQQFKNTLSLVKAAQFSRVHVFSFSPRKGTPAASFKPLVDERTKKMRRLILEKAAENSSFAFRKKLLTQNLSVLFEKRENGYWCGYSRGYIYVKVISEENLKNQIRKVKVNHVSLTETLASL